MLPGVTDVTGSGVLDDLRCRAVWLRNGCVPGQDPYTLASALHVAQILMEKLPAVFRVYFVREGVLNEINLLATRHDGTAVCACTHFARKARP